MTLPHNELVETINYLIDECHYSNAHIGFGVVEGDMGLICLFPYMTTWGLQYGVTRDGVQGRFCFQDAVESFVLYQQGIHELDADHPPPGNWIKHKGTRTVNGVREYAEYRNPRRDDYDEALDDLRHHLPDCLKN